MTKFRSKIGLEYAIITLQNWSNCHSCYIQQKVKQLILNILVHPFLSWNWPCLYLYKMCKIFLSYAVDMGGVDRTLIKGTTKMVTYKPLWEVTGVTFRQVPWVLHGSNSGFLELQIFGYVLIIAANPKQELWNTRYSV